MLAEAIAQAQAEAAGAENPSDNEGYKAFRGKYFNNPSGFVKECIAWGKDEGPTEYQDEILYKIAEKSRVCARGPHGLGKTALLAWTFLWFALTRDQEGDTDWKVVCTASAWRQLTKYLFPEIHKWTRRLRWNVIKRPEFTVHEIFTLALRLKSGEGFAVASNNPALIEGAHAQHILYIFDESKSIIPATFDAAEGALTTPNAKAVAMSTPGEPVGRFYDIQTSKKGYSDWWTTHIKKERVIAAGRMTQEWAEARRVQWGEKSAVYLNRVEGEFAASEEDSVIPLSYVEKANERWLEQEAKGFGGDYVCIGADIARFGEAKTVFAPRRGDSITELIRYSGLGLMDTADKLRLLMLQLDCKSIVDVIGIGAGVYDRLLQQNLDVVAFNAAARSSMIDKTGNFRFTNVRSAAWWNLREMLMDELSLVALPPDDTLTGDLTAPKWRVMSGATIVVESKDDIIKRIGRSTDDGDAVIQAFWNSMDITTSYGVDPFGDYRG